MHHAWGDHLAQARSRFPQIKEHVLLPYADALPEADAAATRARAGRRSRRIVALIPDAWLGDEPRFADPTSTAPPTPPT